MKFYKLLLISTLSFFGLSNVQADVISLNPTADGQVKTFGGDSVITDQERISFSQSGGNITNSILEFNLAAIDNSATINSATLELTQTRFVSNTGQNPAVIFGLAFNGDGVINIDDFSAVGTEFIDTTVPKGGSAGDIINLVFSDIEPVQQALAGDLLTLRLETDSFASIQFASLENTDYDAAKLTIDYSVSPVPEPQTLLLMLGALPLVSWIAIRRRKTI